MRERVRARTPGPTRPSDRRSMILTNAESAETLPTGGHRARTTPDEPAALRRLHKELEYYDASATNKRRFYQGFAVAGLVAGASVPVIAGAGVASTVVAVIGGI